MPRQDFDHFFDHVAPNDSGDRFVVRYFVRSQLQVPGKVGTSTWLRGSHNRRERPFSSNYSPF
jgi:hypothetical protein